MKMGRMSQSKQQSRERRMFLFELYLVFSKEVKDSNGKAKYQYKMKMMTTDMSITEHVEGDECKFAVWAGRSPSSESKVSNKLPRELQLFTINHL